MKTFAPAALALLALSLPPCFGQIMPSMTGSSFRINSRGEYEIRATYKLEPGPAPAFVGCPFSAQQILEKTQTLPDGTKIQDPEAGPIPYYQDSAGRLRIDYPFKKPKNLSKSFSLPGQIEIMDPVAGYHYVLDPAHRVAHRAAMQFYPVKMPRPSTRSAQNLPGSQMRGGRAGRPQPEVSVEWLGTKVLDGLALDGRRITVLYPEGAVGNNRPYTTTEEVWDSPELPFPAFRKTVDPRSGEAISAYIHINRGEPDPQLFQVPEGYRIVDETGPFAVTFLFR